MSITSIYRKKFSNFKNKEPQISHENMCRVRKTGNQMALFHYKHNNTVKGHIFQKIIKPFYFIYLIILIKDPLISVCLALYYRYRKLLDNISNK
jgi:hypothetical protein